jgi:hypothetical protein
MLPFQCDQCHYCNIKGREADQEHVLPDRMMMIFIWRANLDAFWSREKTTVDENRQEGEQFVKIRLLLGIDNPFGGVQRGPFPVADTFRMLPAVALILRSLDTGKNSPTLQFKTMRNLCNNFQSTTPEGVGLSMVGDSGKTQQRFSSSPTNSLWFERFIQGARRLMGDLWIPDRALTIVELLASLQILEEDWAKAQEQNDKDRCFEIASLGYVSCSGFSTGL